MADESTFDAFYDAHIARNGSSLNRWVVFVGDHVLLGSMLLALKRPRSGLKAYGSALTALVLGHLVFERNLGQEVSALAKHPLLSLRAEGRFLRAMWRSGPSRFAPTPS